MYKKRVVVKRIHISHISQLYPSLVLCCADLLVTHVLRVVGDGLAASATHLVVLHDSDGVTLCKTSQSLCC